MRVRIWPQAPPYPYGVHDQDWWFHVDLVPVITEVVTLYFGNTEFGGAHPELRKDQQHSKLCSSKERSASGILGGLGKFMVLALAAMIDI
jgi:hypothetical protein